VAPIEEVLAADEIQGNVLPGFNKDFQRLLFLRVTDVLSAKRWLASLVEPLATMREVTQFNALFRAMRVRRGREVQGLSATWVNIAFTFVGLRKLTPAAALAPSAGGFPFGAFRAGIAARSEAIGDPSDPASAGHVSRWKIGGPGREPDALLIVASDLREMIDVEIATLFSLPVAKQLTTPGALAAHGLELLHEETGAPLPQRGHEHFGFRDGISQPGVRGRLSEEDGFITPRLLTRDDPLANAYGKLGQLLIAAGEFIVGYRRQHDQDLLASLDPLPAQPDWTRNGSFLVFRRLRQDVAKFRRFLIAAAANLASKPGWEGATPERLAALLVGRWPSGAPVLRTPAADNPALGADDFANNHFLFIEDSPSATVVHEGATITVPGAKADSSGHVCPFAAHIRKANPRDISSESGSSLTRRLLRRGSPYGPPFPDGATEDDGQDRGLLFLAYTASIESTFEVLQKAWANQIDQPEPGGHDAIIGQAGAEPQRRRTIILNRPGQPSVELPLLDEWVIPTGGGYFFHLRSPRFER
jgi:Dyp-type peroxidase family